LLHWEELDVGMLGNWNIGIMVLRLGSTALTNRRSGTVMEKWNNGIMNYELIGFLSLQLFSLQ